MFFSGRNRTTPPQFLRDGGTELHRFGNDIDQSSPLPTHIWIFGKWKSEHIKGDWGRKSKPNFGLFDPSKDYREGMGEMFA